MKCWLAWNEHHGQQFLDGPNVIGIGIPDDEAGELIKGVVVLHKGQNTPSEEILACMNGKLAGYKCLHFIEFLDAIPKTVSFQKSRVRKHEKAAVA